MVLLLLLMEVTKLADGFFYSANCQPSTRFIDRINKVRIVCELKHLLAHACSSRSSTRSSKKAVSYTHLTLPTIYSV